MLDQMVAMSSVGDETLKKKELMGFDLRQTTKSQTRQRKRNRMQKEAMSTACTYNLSVEDMQALSDMHDNSRTSASPVFTTRSSSQHSDIIAVPYPSDIEGNGRHTHSRTASDLSMANSEVTDLEVDFEEQPHGMGRPDTAQKEQAWIIEQAESYMRYLKRILRSY